MGWGRTEAGRAARNKEEGQHDKSAGAPRVGWCRGEAGRRPGGGAVETGGARLPAGGGRPAARSCPLPQVPEGGEKPASRAGRQPRP